MNMPEELHWMRDSYPKQSITKISEEMFASTKLPITGCSEGSSYLKCLSNLLEPFFLRTDSFCSPHENRSNPMHFELVNPSKKKAAVFPISIQWHTRQVTPTVLFFGRFCIRESSCNAQQCKETSSQLYLETLPTVASVCFLVFMHSQLFL